MVSCLISLGLALVLRTNSAPPLLEAHGSWCDHVKGSQVAQSKHWVLYLFYKDAEKVSTLSVVGQTQQSLLTITLYAKMCLLNWPSSSFSPPHKAVFLYGQNSKPEIHKLLEFLEKTLLEDIINKIIHHTSFDVMKEKPMLSLPTYVTTLSQNS